MIVKCFKNSLERNVSRFRVVSLSELLPQQFKRLKDELVFLNNFLARL